MASRRLSASLLRSSAASLRNTSSSFTSAAKSPTAPLPPGFLLNRVAQYAKSASPAVAMPAGGLGGKITDEMTEGLGRGQRVLNTRSPTAVPVGIATLGRSANVIDDPIDKRGEITTEQQIPVTGVKMVDLLSPYQWRGKTGVFGVTDAGKSALIMEMINNAAKARGGFSVFAGVGERISEKEDLKRFSDICCNDLIRRDFSTDERKWGSSFIGGFYRICVPKQKDEMIASVGSVLK